MRPMWPRWRLLPEQILEVTFHRAVDPFGQRQIFRFVLTRLCAKGRVSYKARPKTIGNRITCEILIIIIARCQIYNTRLRAISIDL